MNSNLIGFNTIVDSIDNYSVVTFDVFDTLLIRQYVIDPADIFYFLALSKGYSSEMSLKFKNDRVRAENICREKSLLIDDHPEIDVVQVYELLRQYESISADDEIEFENQCLIRRPLVQRLYEAAKDKNKKIYAISDIYIPSVKLNDILCDHGYSFENVWASCEHGGGKYDKILFKKFLEQEKVDASEVLHIGDNRHSDFNMAVELGINAIHIPKAIDNLYMESSINLGTISLYHKESSFFCKAVLAYLSRRIEDVGEFGVARQFGAIYASPLVFMFANWLNKTALENNVKSLYLMARDGFLLSEVMSNVEVDVEVHVLKCSRRALMLPAAYYDKSYWEVFF